MNPVDAMLLLLAVWTGAVIAAALVIERVTWRWRERRRTAAAIATQAPPVPAVDPIAEQLDVAAAILNPDGDITPAWARRCLAEIQAIPTTGSPS